MDLGARRLRTLNRSPEQFRVELTAVSALDRDAWFDALLGLEELPDDVALPAGSVPYLPAPVEVLRTLVERDVVASTDHFVDVGGGIGRAACAIHLLTGARVTVVELQPQLVAQGEALAQSLRLPIAFVCGDATLSTPRGTVYFLYCPFDVRHATRWLDAVPLEPGVRIATLDLALPAHPSLRREDFGSGLRVYHVA